MKQRHPFDIYRDQYEALQELALEERKQGGIGRMSAMVREALDTLIAAKRLPKSDPVPLVRVEPSVPVEPAVRPVWN